MSVPYIKFPSLSQQEGHWMPSVNAVLPQGWDTSNPGRKRPDLMIQECAITVLCFILFYGEK